MINKLENAPCHLSTYIVYCCLKKYYHLSSLKKHTFIISQSGLQAQCNWAFCLGHRGEE